MATALRTYAMYFAGVLTEVMYVLALAAIAVLVAILALALWQ
jgi:hypothetical protein